MQPIEGWRIDAGAPAQPRCTHAALRCAAVNLPLASTRILTYAYLEHNKQSCLYLFNIIFHNNLMSIQEPSPSNQSPFMECRFLDNSQLLAISASALIICVFVNDNQNLNMFIRFNLTKFVPGRYYL